MKKAILFLVVLCISFILQAQVSKTITNLTPGELITQLTSEELTTITNLTLSGTIDARDFKIMRQTMTKLAVVDLSNTTVAAYNGSGGLDSGNLESFPANTILYAFDGKISLTSVILPALIASIDKYAFRNCSNLTFLNMPTSVTMIGEGSFFGCSALKSITLPNSLTTIGTGAFTNCKGLTSIDLPNAVTSIGNSAFLGCSGLTSVTLPNSITTISNGLFAECSSLTFIVLPTSVTSIGLMAFINCNQLASIYAYSSTPPVVLTSSNVFDGVNKSTCTLNIPAESLDLYKAANVWKDFIKTAVITSTGKEIKNQAITVSPNPAKDVITIHTDEGMAAIYNSNGKLIVTQSLKQNKQLNIRSLKPGMYVVVVNEESFKIIKE